MIKKKILLSIIIGIFSLVIIGGTIFFVCKNKEKSNDEKSSSSSESADYVNDFDYTSVYFNLFECAENLSQTNSFYSKTVGSSNLCGMNRSIFSERGVDGNTAYRKYITSSNYVNAGYFTYYYDKDKLIKTSLEVVDGETAEWDEIQAITTESYTESFGYSPDALSLIRINDKSLLSGKFITQIEDEYVYIYEFDPELSTKNYAKEVKTVLGLTEEPKFNKVVLTISINSEWEIISIDYHFEYTVSLMNGATVIEDLTETFSKKNQSISRETEELFAANSNREKQTLSVAVQKSPLMDIINGYQSIVESEKATNYKLDFGGNNVNYVTLNDETVYFYANEMPCKILLKDVMSIANLGVFTGNNSDLSFLNDVKITYANDSDTVYSSDIDYIDFIDYINVIENDFLFSINENDRETFVFFNIAEKTLKIENETFSFDYNDKRSKLKYGDNYYKSDNSYELFDALQKTFTSKSVIHPFINNLLTETGKNIFNDFTFSYSNGSIVLNFLNSEIIFGIDAQKEKIYLDSATLNLGDNNVDIQAVDDYMFFNFSEITTYNDMTEFTEELFGSMDKLFNSESFYADVEATFIYKEKTNYIDGTAFFCLDGNGENVVDFVFDLTASSANGEPQTVSVELLIYGKRAYVDYSNIKISLSIEKFLKYMNDGTFFELISRSSSSNAKPEQNKVDSEVNTDDLISSIIKYVSFDVIDGKMTVIGNNIGVWGGELDFTAKLIESDEKYPEKVNNLGEYISLDDADLLFSVIQESAKSKSFSLKGTITLESVLSEITIKIVIKCDIVDGVQFYYISLERSSELDLLKPYNDLGGVSYIWFNSKDNFIYYKIDSLKIVEYYGFPLKKLVTVEQCKTTKEEAVAHMSELLFDLIQLNDFFVEGIRGVKTVSTTKTGAITTVAENTVKTPSIKSFEYIPSKKTFSFIFDMNRINEYFNDMLVNITHDEDMKIMSLSGSLKMFESVDLCFNFNQIVYDEYFGADTKYKEQTQDGKYTVKEYKEN